MDARHEARWNSEPWRTDMLSQKALQNKATVEAFLAGTHHADIDAVDVIDETVNPEIVCHGFPGFNPTSRETYKDWFRFFRAHFTNMTFEVPVLIADEDHVAARWIVHADHTADFAGVAATGRRISFDGVAVYRMRDGRISETWLHANEAALMAAITAKDAA
jgi:steroid delta-isomerase-like uncharacterized protein